MNYAQLITRLEEIHQTLIAILDDIPDDAYRCQYHKDLSPLGWHLGHTLFIENLWLYERVIQQDSLPDELHYLYIPTHCPKPERGKQLPAIDTMLEQVSAQQQANVAMLRTAPAKLLKHPLMKKNYLLKFLIQHHVQHIETMRMINTQRLLHNAPSLDQDGMSQSDAFAPSKIHFDTSDPVTIGGNDEWCFDNELPAYQTSVKTFAINKNPVSNAQYLQFIEDDGYQRTEHWSADGKQWLAKEAVDAPNGWLCNDNGQWFQISCDHNHTLDPNAPVYGINYHEACAYANYAGARLPHEYEWEIAARADKLSHVNTVWEWCANPFHPYPNFSAFPYPEYSPPAFDNKHYTLRGASRFSEIECHRITFRNFHTAEKRHIFAGLRLAFDA